MNDNITLREHIETILKEREKALNAAADTLQVHLANLNHWKEETIKERTCLVSKEVYYAEHKELTRRIEQLENCYSRLVGIGIALVAGAGLLGAVIMHLFK